MEIELRCDRNRLFGVLDVAKGTLEVKCRSTACGSEPGVVVLHYYSIATGELLKTRQYRDTPISKEGALNDHRR